MSSRKDSLDFFGSADVEEAPGIIGAVDQGTIKPSPKAHLQLSQPDPIEILAEKVTVQSILNPVAAGFHPDGVPIAPSFVRSIRHDFRHGSGCHKTLLIIQQVQQSNLPSYELEIELTSSRCKEQVTCRSKPFMLSKQAVLPSPKHPSTPSRQYVRSRRFCNCENRWLCESCREAWIRRRQRTTESWLQNVVTADTSTLFVGFTIPTSGEWLLETEEIWDRWRKLGRNRSLHRQRKVEGELAFIKRGVACLHLVNKYGVWQPHLHAVVVASKGFDRRAIKTAWCSMGPGNAEVELADSFGATVRYSIADKLPESFEDRLLLAEMLRGKRLVRRIGR